VQRRRRSTSGKVALVATAATLGARVREGLAETAV
jgi:hypothetical protein